MKKISSWACYSNSLGIKKILQIMKLTITMLLLVVFQAGASIYSQGTRLEYAANDKTLKEILKDIEKETEFRFFYNDDFNVLNKVTSINVKNKSISEVLEILLSKADVTYKVLANNIVVITPVESFQNIQIKGKITDEESGEPLPGVNVTIVGTTLGTVTDMDGNYTISVNDPNATLEYSFVGYVSEKRVVSGQSVINVTLKSDIKNLEEVVVVGYGTQKKRDVTGAVASFKGDAIEERPLSRVDQALVGQMAGVQVKQTSGSLGKAFSIQVRGSGSISAGNEPLYVLDGFPLATASPNSAGNYSTGNPLDNINPNDIESIQVLKDAAAAAIYGSRAANGVVLITTKRGQSGKPKITFSAYGGFNEANRKLDMLSADEWVDRATEMINAQWVASGAGRTASQTTEERRQILGLAPGVYNTNYMIDDRWNMEGHPGLNYIDWQDEAFRKGMIQNYQISANGGNEYVKYYISGNYQNQEGMIKGMDYTGYSARANLEVSVNKKLKFGINLSPTYSIVNDPGVEGKDNILHQLIGYTPVQEDTMGLYPNTGDYGQYKWSNSPNSPIAKLEQKVGKTTRYRTLASIFGEYVILKGLTFKTTVNLDNTDNNSKSYSPYTIASSLSARKAQLSALTSGSSSGYRKQTFVNENTLAYNVTLASKHDISLLAGASFNSDQLSDIKVSSNGGYNSSVVTTLNEATAVTGSTTETKNVLLSYFGRVQYSYDGKYLLSGSIRRDGSSRFGSNTKWGVFPSASFGWRVSEENFMKGLKPVSDLKLRFSWGKSGNNNIGDYSSIPILATYNYTFNGVQVVGQAPNGIVNPDITWEESNTIDLGMEIGLLKNRITGSFDYYNKLNTGLLLNVPVPETTGFATNLSNTGKVRNKGWEIEITTRNLTGNFQWTTSGNLSHNANEVEALASGQTQIFIPSLFDIPHSILRVGEQMNSIYVVKQIGILSQEDIDNNVALYGSETVGDPKYYDANDDKVIDANDRVIVGHPNPSYVWGITNSFKYKGFDLSVLVQGQTGGSIYSLLGRAISRTGQGYVDNALGTFANRWRSAEDPGDGKVSKAYSTFGRIKNTDWLYSSDYWRIRNITLGYDLKQVIKSPVVQGARVYVTLENWFGKDKYTGGFNPEASNTDLSGNTSFPEAGDYGGLPIARSLIFGLNFTF
jgi:TonB-linked SusC/RagA family outer membrane protein